MSSFRFFQGVRGEWVWYRLTDAGVVLAKGDGAFDTLENCMANAERFGFDGRTYVVQGQQHEQAELLLANEDSDPLQYPPPPTGPTGSDRESTGG